MSIVSHSIYGLFLYFIRQLLLLPSGEFILTSSTFPRKKKKAKRVYSHKTKVSHIVWEAKTRLRQINDKIFSNLQMLAEFF